MRRNALVLATLAIFGLFSMPLHAGCPGRCELPTVEGELPQCVTYYVLVTGCNMWSESLCVEDVCVTYPDDDPGCREPPPYNADITPLHEVEDAGKLAETCSGEPGGADQQKSLCRAGTEVDGPEIEVLETVQIPART